MCRAPGEDHSRVAGLPGQLQYDVNRGTETEEDQLFADLYPGQS